MKEVFKAIVKSFYKGAAGIILVYNISEFFFFFFLWFSINFICLTG